MFADIAKFKTPMRSGGSNCAPPQEFKHLTTTTLCANTSLHLSLCLSLPLTRGPRRNHPCWHLALRFFFFCLQHWKLMTLILQVPGRYIHFPASVFEVLGPLSWQSISLCDFLPTAIVKRGRSWLSWPLHQPGKPQGRVRHDMDIHKSGSSWAGYSNGEEAWSLMVQRAPRVGCQCAYKR